MIKISKSQLDMMEQKSGKISKEWDDIANKIAKIEHGLDMEILAMENIKESLTKSEKSARKEKEFYAGFQDALKKTKADFVNEEKKIASKITGAIAIAAGAVGGKVSGTITGNKINTPGTKVNVASDKTTTPTSGVKTSTATGNTGTVPKMDSKAIKDEIQNRYNKIHEWREVEGNFSGQCSRLVNYQLQEKGILKLTKKYENEFGIKVNGCEFASELLNRDDVLINGYKATKYENYDALFKESKNGVMTNIVVSFTKESGVTSKNAGHVLLIDRIQDGKVYYVDNFGTWDDKQKAGQVRELSISAFKSLYNKPNGIAHIHQ